MQKLKKGSNTIVIDPVTRIEGHSKITIRLDEHGMVQDTQFHVTQIRGFEKLCEGRPFYEMPSLMARICGICPVSHLIASAKACDALLAVGIPRTAANLRKVMHLAQTVQSHALSFFHLSSPDFLLGMDSDPAQRNILGVLKQNPQMASDGIKLRKFGQQVIEKLAGKRIHPSWIVPGGVNEPLDADRRDQILEGIPEAMSIIQRTLSWFKGTLDNFREEIRTFANFPTLFMGLASDHGGLELYDGWIRVMDADGKIVADHLDPAKYYEYIGEAVEPHTLMKMPYYKPMGYPDGIYRVGPLARINLASRLGTPLADQEWAEFRELERRTVLSSFYYHYARLIETLYALEAMQNLLKDPDILSTHIRAFAGPNNMEGVGVCEAPRGLLIHHYKINPDGLITWANLIVATGHNNLAMNRGVTQAAKHFIKGRVLTEGMLNRVEAVIRAFDPCLSCGTHALGQMPLDVELRGPENELFDQVRRG
jgi:NAD-reducing hydrogenase large subunit